MVLYKPADLGAGRPFITMGYLIKIAGHLRAARLGDRDAESKLINRLGELRAAFNSKEDFIRWAKQSQLDEVLPEAFHWLKSVGRVVNLSATDQSCWISCRGGFARTF
jgi:hypothetical protein